MLDGYRRQLGEELGLDPSPAVDHPAPHPAGREAGHSPDVADVASEDQGPPTPTQASARSRRWVIAAAVAAVVAFAAFLGWRWADDPDQSVGDITGPTLISIDPETGHLVDALALPVVPAQIESSGDLLTVRSEADQAVAVVDLAAGDAAKVTGLTAPPSALAMDGDAAVVGLGFSGETVTVTGGRVGCPEARRGGRSGTADPGRQRRRRVVRHDQR